MFCYLVRHGKDDYSVRGGWNNLPLTADGLAQAEALAEYLVKNQFSLDIKHIFSSDLMRARQTAYPLSERLRLPIEYISEFREVNNGLLSGMNNETAKEQFPGLYWNTLNWQQKYPEGESPKEFYERVKSAWMVFSKEIINLNENVLLVTHSGVINVIRCIINDLEYSNKHKYPTIPHAEPILLEFADGKWHEKM